MASTSLALCCLVAPQTEPVQTLVEKLRVGTIAEREQAARDLKAAGAGALPELEKAAAGRDPELADRARRLVHVLRIMERLGAPLLRACPGIEERLARDGQEAWAHEFLRLCHDPARARGFRVRDLDAFGVEALRAARNAIDKEYIARLLVKGRFPSAGAELVRLLEHDRPEVRNGALRALEELGGKDHLAAIRRRLDDLNAYVRSQAALTLASMNDRESRPRIAVLLKGGDLSVRSDAAVALLLLGSTEGLVALEAALQHETGAVDAARALLQHDRKAYLPAVLPLLHRGQPYERIHAAELLAETGAVEAVPDLLKMLKDPDDYVPVNAASALADLGAREAVDGILALMAGTNAKYFRESYLEDLRRLRAKEAAPAILKSLSDENHWVRCDAITTLADLVPEIATPVVTPLLKDPNVYVRLAAAKTLARLGEGDARAALLDFLRDADAHVRRTAAATLGELGVKEATSAILKLLEDKEEPVREAAAEALGALGERGPAAALRRQMAVGTMPDRIDAIRRLAQLRAAEAVGDFQRALEDPAPRVRAAAADALCELGRKEGVALLLKESPDLHALNALRQPGAWKRLRHCRPSDQISHSTLREQMQRSVRKAGSRLEWGCLLPGSDGVWVMRSSSPLGTWMAQDRFLENLEDAPLSASPFAAILEPDRVRIVRREEALAFWNAWWADEAKKK